jgi:phosphatidylglycerophosphate synthase
MSQVSAERGAVFSGGSVADLYRATRKRQEPLFNTYVCRPLAAFIVYPLRSTRVTSNQVTFFSLFLALVAAALFNVVRWPLGLWLGVALYEVSYIFDKVDGMLARARGLQSQTGHLLDFLMDEIKAFFILAAVASGAYLTTGRVDWLYWGLAGVVCLASGIGITTFQRRPEVLAEREQARAAKHATVSAAAATSASASPSGSASTSEPEQLDAAVAPAAQTRPSALRSAIALAERVGRFFIHYPSYIWIAALLGDARIFVYPYVAVNVLYVARSMLGLLVVYGRFASRSGTPDIRTSRHPP